MTARDTSPAYKALLPSTRKILALIEREVERGNGQAAIRFADFEDFGIPPGSIGLALRLLSALGFVVIERQPPRHVNTFRLSDHWRSIDATEAAKLRREAGKARPKRLTVAKPRRVARHVPSLPRMSWDRVT